MTRKEQDAATALLLMLKAHGYDKTCAACQLAAKAYKRLTKKDWDRR